MRRSQKSEIRTVVLLLRGSARNASIELVYILVLLVLQASAEQPGLQTKRTKRLQDRGAGTTASQSFWRARSNVAVSADNMAHEGTVTASVPFIRPIAPMSTLFPDDDLLRVPWSNFGLHRTPVRFHSRPVASLRDPAKPRAESHSESGNFMAASDPMSSLTRLASNHLMLPLPRPSPAAPESLTSNVMPPSGIGSERATQIQAALVRYGYLTGAPTGSWDAPSINAMRKLQSDHRWQTKFMPDARALILLGLGPGDVTP